MEKNIAYKDYELKTLQIELKKILRSIISICDRHKIPYFALGGTLLGVVRHNDFIPWDDDIDIGMLREDYEKFIYFAKNELPEDYFCLNFEINNNCPFSFTKVCKKNTVFVEWETRKLDYPHNIFVDIMPYDFCPLDSNKRISFLKKVSRRHQIFKSKILTQVSTISKGKKGKIGKIVRPLIHFVLLPIPRKSTYASYKKITTFYKPQLNDAFISFWGVEKFANHYNDYFPLEKGKFGDLEINIPRKYDKILTKQYGDYMKLPSEENRVSHSPYKFKL